MIGGGSFGKSNCVFGIMGVADMLDEYELMDSDRETEGNIGISGTLGMCPPGDNFTSKRYQLPQGVGFNKDSRGSVRIYQKLQEARKYMIHF